ncbi:MAG: DUF3667 domain-containing protein [Flavisolibacter sp.]
MEHSKLSASKEIKRITFSGMVYEMLHLVTHVENNFVFTVKNLFARPGKMIREYILGKRQPYQKPFAMLFICIALFSFTMWVFYELHPIQISPLSGWDDVYKYNFEYVVLHKYFTWIQLALVPVYGMILKLFNWKSSYNYGELVVFYCYLFSGILLILVPFVITQQFLPLLRLPFIEIAISVLYTIWVCIGFFRPTGDSFGSIILKTTLGTVLSYFVMILTYKGITWFLTWWHFRSLADI